MASVAHLSPPPNQGTKIILTLLFFPVLGTTSQSPSSAAAAGAGAGTAGAAAQNRPPSDSELKQTTRRHDYDNSHVHAYRRATCAPRGRCSPGLDAGAAA